MHDLSLFDYELPPEAIAQEPLVDRDASRLLVLDRVTHEGADARFRDLPRLLRPGDLLVANRSRVFPARLLGRRQTGGRVEVFLVRERGAGTYDALLRPARRLSLGEKITIGPSLSVWIEALPAAATSPAEDGLGRVRLETSLPATEAVEREGHIPLPPYIRRADGEADRERYQTVYARESGSVAAPTAGLHFTADLIDRLRQAGIGWAEIVLHVGPGTFRPVSVEDVRQHKVPSEPFEVPGSTVEAVARARNQGGRIIAVGTTVVRALETAASSGMLVAARGETDLVVLPGHRFQVVDGLITNFHLPRSSLLILVSAFAGREAVLAAYRHAILTGYRFYSYGDAMLIV